MQRGGRLILSENLCVNPWGPSEKILKAFSELENDLKFFPDSTAQHLREEITRHFPLFIENVIAGNGASALLSQIVRLMAPKRALLVDPCPSEYRRVLNLQSAEVRSCLLREKDDFQFPFSEIVNMLRGVDLLVIAAPNYPTGTSLSKEQMMELLAEAKRRNVFVVVDESMADWSPELSVAKEVKDNSYFLVIRSLDFFYAIPSLRCAYALGARRLIQKLQSFQESFSCNHYSQKLGALALSDSNYREKTLAWFHEEKAWFQDQLQALGLFKVFPSETNFLMLKTKPPYKNASLIDFLGTEGVKLEKTVGFPGLDAAYVVMPIALREINEKIIQRIKTWMEKTVHENVPSENSLSHHCPR